MRHGANSRTWSLGRVGVGLALLGTFLVVPLISAAPALATGAPFSCEAPTDFSAPNGTQLVAVPEGSGVATALGPLATFPYNALAFDADDHYLYAITSGNTMSGTGLVRIDSAGTETLIGQVSGLPAPGPTYSYASGAIDDQGNYWVLSNDPSVVTAYRIDMTTHAVAGSLRLTGGAFGPTDWTFAAGFLWGLDGTTLYHVDLTTGTVTAQFVASVSSDTYNAAWTFADGSLGFLKNDANQVVRITLGSSGTFSVATQALTGAIAYAGNNDGTSCAPALGISLDNLTGTVNVPYTGHLQAVGGSEPYTWSLAEGTTLPAGLDLDAGTGAISGTPTAAGTFTFTVAAVDTVGTSAEHAETITIYPGPFSCAAPTIFAAPTGTSGTSQLLAISETSSPTATALGSPSAIGYNALAYNRRDGYLYAIAVSGGTTHQPGNHLVRIDSGGNVFDLGSVVGLPVAGDPQSMYEAGAFDDAGTFWITNRDTLSVAYAIDVNRVAVTQDLNLDTQFAPTDWTADDGYLWGQTDGDVFQVDLTTGHVASVPTGDSMTATANADWTNADGSLGFIFAANGNRIYKLPVQAGPLTAESIGTMTFTTVTSATLIASNDNDGAACRPALSLSTAPGTGSADYQQPYSGALQVTGGTAPYTWSISSGSLPPGVTLNADGSITGTPTAAGSFPFTARVVDSSTPPQSGTEDVTIDVARAQLAVTAASASMVYGSSVPAIVPSYSGFLGSDDVHALTSLPACGTTATSTSDVGTYPTTCSGGAAANYSLTYVPGQLLVTRAPQTITFTSTPPSPALIGGIYTPTATGGGSGNPVVLSIDAASATACTLTGGAVTFTGSGYCAIDANQAGNTDYADAAQVQQVVIVGYRTAGFLAPVANAPIVNTGKAGRTYPLKWQLQQADGQYVTSLAAVRSISVVPTSCSAFTSDPSAAVAATTSGGTSLRYDTTTNQYVYNWQTSAPGCYSLFVDLTSGQALTAYFHLS